MGFRSGLPVGSAIVAQGLQSADSGVVCGTGLVAWQQVGSSWTTDQTPLLNGVPCTARQNLNHWLPTREAPGLLVFIFTKVVASFP